MDRNLPTVRSFDNENDFVKCISIKYFEFSKIFSFSRFRLLINKEHNPSLGGSGGRGRDRAVVSARILGRVIALEL